MQTFMIGLLVLNFNIDNNLVNKNVMFTKTRGQKSEEKTMDCDG